MARRSAISTMRCVRPAPSRTAARRRRRSRAGRSRSNPSLSSHSRRLSRNMRRATASPARRCRSKRPAWRSRTIRRSRCSARRRPILRAPPDWQRSNGRPSYQEPPRRAAAPSAERRRRTAALCAARRAADGTAANAAAAVTAFAAARAAARSAAGRRRDTDRDSPAATLACPIVSALDRWFANAVQPAAQKWFNQPVVEIKQISAYSCRGMNGQPGAHISEHAFGNALDIAAFVLADGHRITVEGGWKGSPEEQGFLRDVQGSACDQFTTVLAPGSNQYHYNHIHVDLMRRASGRRICQPGAVDGEVVASRARMNPRYASSRPVEPPPTRRYDPPVEPGSDPFAWRGDARHGDPGDHRLDRRAAARDQGPGGGGPRLGRGARPAAGDRLERERPPQGVLSGLLRSDRRSTVSNRNARRATNAYRGSSTHDPHRAHRRRTCNVCRRRARPWRNPQHPCARSAHRTRPARPVVGAEGQPCAWTRAAPAGRPGTRLTSHRRRWAGNALRSKCEVEILPRLRLYAAPLHVRAVEYRYSADETGRARPREETP